MAEASGPPGESAHALSLALAPPKRERGRSSGSSDLPRRLTVAPRSVASGPSPAPRGPRFRSGCADGGGSRVLCNGSVNGLLRRRPTVLLRSRPLGSLGGRVAARARQPLRSSRSEAPAVTRAPASSPSSPRTQEGLRPASLEFLLLPRTSLRAGGRRKEVVKGQTPRRRAEAPGARKAHEGPMVPKEKGHEGSLQRSRERSGTDGVRGRDPLRGGAAQTATPVRRDGQHPIIDRWTQNGPGLDPTERGVPVSC